MSEKFNLGKLVFDCRIAVSHTKATNEMKKTEIAIYLFVGASSLVLISYTVRMFTQGLLEEETIVKAQIVVAILWALGLAGLGWDIAKKRRQQ